MSSDPAEACDRGQGGVRIPPGWALVRLDEAIDVNPPRVFASPRVPKLEMADLQPLQRRHAAPSQQVIPAGGSRFRDGDVLLARITPSLENGKCAQVSGLGPGVVAVGSTEFIVLAPKSDAAVDPAFIYHLVTSPRFRAYVIGAMEGTSGRQRTPNHAVAEFPLLVPQLEEQAAIVAVLDASEGSVDTARAFAAKQEQLVIALSDALLLPAFGEPPEGWRPTTLGGLIDSSRGGTWGAAPRGDDDVVCIRAADFDRVRLRALPQSAPLRYVPPAQRARQLLEPGDIVLEKSGGGPDQPVGLAVLYTTTDRPAVCSNFALRIRLSGSVDPRFLTYLMGVAYRHGANSPAVQQTTGIQNLNVRRYLATPVAVPELPEQRRIADVLDVVHEQTSRAATEAEKLTDLRRGLADALLSGRVRAAETRVVA
jgi:type I restriction enzyme, S subunit